MGPEATDGQMETHVNGLVSEMLTSIRRCKNDRGEMRAAASGTLFEGGSESETWQDITSNKGAGGGRPRTAWPLSECWSGAAPQGLPLEGGGR